MPVVVAECDMFSIRAAQVGSEGEAEKTNDLACEVAVHHPSNIVLSENKRVEGIQKWRSVPQRRIWPASPQISGERIITP